MMPESTFASSLLDEKSHHSLVNLGEGEIKTIENLKSYLTKQVGIIEHYLHSIQKLNSTSDIAKYGLDEDSPFVKTWQVFYSENIQVSAILNQLSSNFSSSIIPRLDKLLSHMKEAHKHYNTHRFRIDSELKTVCEQEGRLNQTYQQHGEEVQSTRQRLESNKAKPDKTKQDRFKKASLKLYQNHNEYVLALNAATIHQSHYETGIVPNLMNSLQTIKQDLVIEWKSILDDVSQYIKAYAERYSNLADALASSVNEVKDENPYEPFIVKKGGHHEPHPGYAFDESLLNIPGTNLMANELAVNDLTVEQLKTKNTLLEKSVAETKAQLSQKSSDYQTSKQMLNDLKEASKGSMSSIFVKQMAVAELSRELKELSCTHAKAVSQRETINSALEKLNGSPPPSFSDVPYTAPTEPVSFSDGKRPKTLPRMITNMLKKPPAPLPREENDNLDPGHSPDGMQNHNRPLPMTPGMQDDVSDAESDVSDPPEYDKPVEVPLQDEPWYHGMISREETEALLNNEGDYLVRESKRKPGNYVLSARWEGIRHFIIQQDESGKFRLEGEGYTTVTHLIDFHKKNQCPVTKKSNAVLKNPILRQAGMYLDHDNIVVETKLGRGHFGDVMKGRLKDSGEEVAVKTCRDNVLPAVKEKFLQEAEILAQYNHPNIVKLIGVAVNQEPAYIVMELMEGGDFLNYLRKHGSEILPHDLLQYGIDAANGMTYLESKGCIHRDLAARNCLLDKQKVLKISDFGMSRETDIYECSNMREIPVKWTAPEALNYTQYTTASDVWSFGVLLWETYSLGNTPYPGLNNKDTRDQVDRGYRMPPPLGTPTPIYELMKDCWEYEPQNRPQFRTILAKLMQIKLLG